MPPAESLNNIIVAYFNLASAGGPLVVSWTITCTLGLLAWICWLVPKTVRPIAQAIQMVRRGTSEREIQLGNEVEVLKAKVRILEDRDEELRRALDALMTFLESMSTDKEKDALFAMVRSGIGSLREPVHTRYQKIVHAGLKAGKAKEEFCG